MTAISIVLLVSTGFGLWVFWRILRWFWCVTRR
jgi:hypothetical protein